MNETSFGAWLRRLRRSHDLTQEALAEQAGCAVDTLRAIETERRRPSRELAEILAKCLAVPEAERAAFVQLARRGQPAPSPAPPALPAATSGLTTIPLIGRAAELAVLAAYLADPACRLLTIVGPGGMGKTSLAAQAAVSCAPQFPDGVIAVALAGATASAAAVGAIARALGTGLAGERLETQIIAALAPRHTLLFLDNLEQLLADEGLTTLLLAILAQAPGVQILATSRRPLRLRAEQVVSLGGLSLPDSSNRVMAAHGDAVLLFVERARRLRHDFALTPDNEAAIVAICRLLDGLPLAIELAAAWTPLLSCAEIAQELTRSLDVLASDERDLPGRHRSLRAVFTSSWQLLAANQQQALARLALFRGGFTREAAEEVAQAGLPQLAALGQASLLRREGQRYTLHEMTRQYAAEQLGSGDEHAAAMGRLLAYYRTLATGAAADLLTNDHHERITQLADELDNLRSALGEALLRRDGATGASLCAGLRALWALSGPLREGVGWVEAFLDLPNLARAERALLYSVLIPLLRVSGQWERALHATHEALALLDAADDPLVRAGVLAAAGLAELDGGAYSRAEHHLLACLTLTQELGNRYLEALTLCNLGHAYLFAGATASARDCYHRAQSLATGEGAELTVAHARYGCAALATLERDRRGEPILREVLPIFQRFGFMLLIAHTLEALAAQAGLGQAHQGAGRLFGAANQLRAQHHLPLTPGMVPTLHRLAAMARGPLDAATWEQAVAVGRSLTIDQAITLALTDANAVG